MMPFVFALVCIALLVFETWQHGKLVAAEREREALAAELEHLRKICRDRFAMTPGTATSSHDLLRVLDMHRPIGVSLRAVVAEFQQILERGDYP